MSVGHLFFERDNNLGWVELRYLHGTELKEFFEGWLKQYPDPYPQRYRKSIPNGFVKKNGILLMRLIEGEVDYPDLEPTKSEDLSGSS